jgi:hypothetical protein
MDGEEQQELVARLKAIETRLEALTQQGLTERLARMEDKLLLITDIERYQKLQGLLKVGKLQEADDETVHVIMQEAGKSDREDLTPDAVKLFPCSVLQVIDRLWTNYTGGRFGFSVQLRLYQEVGGTLETAIAQDADVLRKLGDKVGWRENSQWKTVDQAAHQMTDPVGCYPVVWWSSPYGAKMVNYFLNRLFTCDL